MTSFSSFAMTLDQKASSRVWLITGCSSGFGRLFISAILARGDRVVATARNIDSLSEFAPSDNVHLLQLDITASQNILDEKIANAITIFGQIDVLINNAGYVLSGVWEELSPSQLIAQFNTNVFGPINLTRALLPHLRSRRTGNLVFMSSIAAWVGVAVGGPYSASKYALEGAVESLEKEVAPFGVNVHLAVLGQFRTEILAKRQKPERVPNPIAEYDALIESYQRRLERADGSQPGDPAQAVGRILDAVCRRGYFAAREGPLRIVLGSDALDVVRNQCSETLRDLERQEKMARSTDFPGRRSIGQYN